MFWKDLENGKFNFLSAEEAIEKYLTKSKPDFVETDSRILSLIEKVQIYNSQEKEIKSIKEELYNRYSLYAKVSVNGETLLIAKPTLTTLNKQYFEKELQKLEEKYIQDKEKLINQIKEFENKTEEKIVRNGFLKFS